MHTKSTSETTKKFFTTENFRLATAIGYDVSWASEEGRTGLITANGTPDGNHFFYHTPASQTISLMLDAYSPTSVIGFYGGAAINFQEYNINDQNKILQDSIKTTNIEFPLYVKARIGNAIGRSHLWIAAGGGYSINTQAKLFQKNVVTGQLSEDIDAQKQFNSQPFLSGIIGYEFMAGGANEPINRDTFRFLLYGKINYDFGNRIDQDGIITNSALSTYTNPDFKFVRISLGIKVLLRLSKAGELLTKTIL